MRLVHWLFAVSVALFVTGIGFTIAAARSARAAPAVETTVKATPVATVEQIMKGIVGPAANVVFAAVGSTSTAQGIEERAPRTNDEWEVVGNNAAALVEAGNLLVMPGRAVDQGEWIGMSQAMMQAARTALAAVEARNPEGILESGDAINMTCDNCHQRYRRN
jgi:translation elongation factor EF-1alpha